jgi:hypothetical protein
VFCRKKEDLSVLMCKPSSLPSKTNVGLVGLWCLTSLSTFSYIMAVRFVLVEETRVLRENHRLKNLSNKIVSSTPRHDQHSQAGSVKVKHHNPKFHNPTMLMNIDD